MTATAINLAAKQELRDSCGLTDEEQGVVWPAGEQITDAQAEEMAKCAALMGAAMRMTIEERASALAIYDGYLENEETKHAIRKLL